MFEVTKIGVGAFWFLPKKQLRTTKFTQRDYIDLIEFGLCKHNDIDLLSFETHFDDSFDNLIDLETDWKEVIDNGGHFDLPAFFKTTFIIKIPKQWQLENTAKWRGVTIDAPIEITIYDTFYYPVTFVRLLDFSRENEADGSNCIYVSRKYLEYLFSNDPHLEFESIGPSPFHVDFELLHAAFSSVEPVEFECRRKPKRGYDLVVFQYNATALGSNDHDDAYAHLIYCLAPQLGLYYHTSASQIRIINAWNEVSNNHARLVDLSGESNANKIGSIFKISSLVRASIVDIVNFESEYKSTMDYIKNELDDDKNRGVATYLDFYLERKIREFPRYDASKYYAFADFIEKRHSKWVEVSILAFAGLVGALIGGLLAKT
jgi:hypothetical protein